MGLAAAPNVDLDIGGAPVPDAHFLSFKVDRDMDQPDSAELVLANQGDVYSTKPIGETVELKVGSPPKTIFKGEIIGLEPTYKGGEKTKIVIRAMDRFHRMGRKRRSMTYTDKADKDIITQLAGDAGLQVDWEHDVTLKYKHVYQHNQSDLEFARLRASRIGCYMWCVGTTLNVKQPNLSGPVTMTLKVDAESDQAQLRVFAPRLSSVWMVNKVTVKGWNPETKELIVGEATVQRSTLGSRTGVSGAGGLASEETFSVDKPIWSREEANVLAKAHLQHLSLTYITGTCELTGNPDTDLGQTIKVTANASADDPFNGTYLVLGITHLHSPSGFITRLRLGRNAQGAP